MKRDFFCCSLILNIIVAVCRSIILLLYKIEGICFQVEKKSCMKAGVNLVSSNEAKYDDVYEKICKYLIEEEHFRDKDLTLKKVAHECQINKVLINETLSAKIHLSFLEFIKEKRIAYACVLLIENPNYKMNVISSESGFNSMRTFGRIFKEMHHMPPTEYRRVQILKIFISVDK